MADGGRIQIRQHQASAEQKETTPRGIGENRWNQLRGPLGFDRDAPPCVTTISRTHMWSRFWLSLRFYWRNMGAYFGKPLYLFQVKANQGETLDASEHCFAKAELRRPATMNDAAVSIHRLKSDPNIPIRAAADHISWNPASPGARPRPQIAQFLTLQFSCSKV